MAGGGVGCVGGQNLLELLLLQLLQGWLLLQLLQGRRLLQLLLLVLHLLLGLGVQGIKTKARICRCQQ